MDSFANFTNSQDTEKNTILIGALQKGLNSKIWLLAR